MFDWLRNLMGANRATAEPAPGVEVRRRRRASATYDAAKSTDAHWNSADILSAASANDPGTRRKLRMRSRYEVANNCHARGLTLTYANDIVGTGPQLQVMLENQNQEEIVEDQWQEWADEICLAEKLNTLALSYAVDGESVAVFTSNPMLYNSVKLDIKLVEADRLTTPFGAPMTEFNPFWADGIVFDEYGNPKAYQIGRAHV